MYTIARLLAETLVFLLWIAAVGLMIRDLKHPKGCDIFGPSEEDPKGPTYCWKDPVKKEQNPRRYDARPIKSWDTAITAGVIEALTFLATIVLVFLDDRRSKVSGGTSYA
ncbi:MAG: hypothetical protein Q9218_002926 [Villophora microphyllina]